MADPTIHQPIWKSVCILLFSAVTAVGGWYVTFAFLAEMQWCCSHSSVLTYSLHFWGLLWGWIGYHIAKPLLRTAGQLSVIPNAAYVASAFAAAPLLLLPLQEKMSVGTNVPVGLAFFPISLALGAFGIYRRIRFADRAGAGLLYAALTILLLTLFTIVPLFSVNTLVQALP